MATWEERWHPLRREWVIVSSHRNDRPWSGETVPAMVNALPAYDPDCYLCPGNARVSGSQNVQYSDVYVFDNDHPCVGPDAPQSLPPAPGIFENRPASGVSRVVAFTPRHNLTLAQLDERTIVRLLTVLQEQSRELAARPDVRHVLVFENKGEVVGVSNPHPHCQIYATNFVFRTIEIETEAQAAYLARTKRALFADIIATEEEDGRRMVVKSDLAVSFIPYFARYPYETYVTPRATRSGLAAMNAAEIVGLGAVLRQTLIRLENLWLMSFPYVMVFHQAPAKDPAPGFHFYIQILPPLRKPGLLKYLAGPEIGGGNFLNDTSPEEKAAELRVVSAVHYTHESAGR